MTSFYTRLNETARRLIKQRGKLITITRTPKTGDAWNPTEGTPETYDGYVVETGYSLTNRNQSLVEQGDKLGVISTEINIVPAMGDTITFGSDDYRFVDLEPLNPGGTTLLYEFLARK